MSGDDPILDRLDEAVAHAQAQQAAADATVHEIQQVTAQAEAADGHVVATVAADGGLVDLTLDPRALRLGSEALAEAIVEASRTATEQCQARVRQLADDLVAQAAGPDGLDTLARQLDDMIARTTAMFDPDGLPTHNRDTGR